MAGTRNRGTGAYLWRVLAIGLVGALAIAGGTALAPGAQAVSSTPDKTDVTNGTVNAVVPTAGAIYIGGKFTQVGPHSGTWVGIDSSTATIMGLPQVSGGTRNGSQLYASEVRAAAPDGSGGYYIGGGFTHVGGLARHNLAHILADGSVDPNFAPNPNRDVNTLAVSGSTVYVGGAFTSIGGQERWAIAALDAATGNATSWDPSADATGVDSLAVSGSTVYVGGSFDHIGGEERRCIAALDATTGAATSWNANAEPNATDYCGVRAIALAPSEETVYVGGDFDHLGGQARNNIAELDAATGAATSWSPNAQGGIIPGTTHDSTEVDALAVSGSLVYAGGLFTSIGGAARNNIAALDRTTGAATGWSPNAAATNPAAISDVLTLAVSGSTVYAGGFFDHIGGQPRDGIAALDAATGAPTSWNPRINRASANPSIVYTLAVSGSTVYAGGFFAAIGGQARRNVAALDPATGEVTSWNPSANGEVDALDVCGSTVYAGGDFTSIGGQSRNRIGALDAATGNATNWNPNANGEVDALQVSPSAVYAGGTFTSIGGKARNAIAALNGATGKAMSWNPSANGGVDALHVSPSTVYAGGSFDHVGGKARNNIAELDAATGAATSWNPNSAGSINALAVSGSTVYVGGGFYSYFGEGSIGGQPRAGIAALDAVTGNATSWDPSLTEGSTVNALAVTGSAVYAGGDFLFPHNIAAFNRTTGASSWSPIANGEVRALEFGPDGSLWVGGAFTEFDAAPQSGIARFAPTQDHGPTDTSSQGPCGGGVPLNAFSFGKVKRSKSKGIAKLTVKVPGPGELDLAETKKLKADHESAEAEGTEQLLLKANGKTWKKLNAKGKLTVKANVTFTPDAGEPYTESKKIKLVKR